MNQLFEDDYEDPFLNSPIPAPQETAHYTIVVSAETAEIDAILSQIKAIPGIRSAMVVSTQI